MFFKLNKRGIVCYLASLVMLMGVTIIYQNFTINERTIDRANLTALKTSLATATIVTIIISSFLTILFIYFLFRPLLRLRHTIQDLSKRKLHLKNSEAEKIDILSENNFLTYIHHLQNEVQTSQSKLNQFYEVLDNLTDGIIIVATDGSIQFMNSSARRLFAVKETLTRDMTLAQVCRHHAIVDLWRDTQLSGESHQCPVELARQRVFLQVFGIPLTDVRSSESLLIFKDITQQHYLETVRKDFISNISHELRTPLASLKALSETLQETLVNDPTTARRFLNNIEVEVDALSLLVQELLELARIESGKLPLQMKVIDPGAVISSAIERLRIQAERKNLSFSTDLPANIPEVLADPIRLEQVLVNLLHNAIKFTPPGGVIKIYVELTPMTITFVVEDNGIGISSKDLPRIFERFYKGDRSRAGEGTGLGLAIARHLVEAHGGNIWAESEEGKGSSFYFSIPLSTR